MCGRESAGSTFGWVLTAERCFASKQNREPVPSKIFMTIKIYARESPSPALLEVLPLNPLTIWIIWFYSDRLLNMDRFPNNEFLFDVNDLKDSDISKHHKRGKFFESDKLPNKIIRAEDFEELFDKHGSKIEISELVEIAKRLYKELEEKYGILVPAEFFLGKDKLGNNVVYSVADKIEGQHLGEIEKSKEVIEKVEALYTSVARYFLDKSKEGGLYLWDICGESQYIYGKKVGDEGDKIYLIDTDIWLNNSRTGMYLVVYWLTRHMSGAEMDFNTKFTEARDYIKQFISQPLPDNMSKDDMKNVGGIRSFLNNEKSDYNPESAIPNFE